MSNRTIVSVHISHEICVMMCRRIQNHFVPCKNHFCLPSFFAQVKSSISSIIILGDPPHHFRPPHRKKKGNCYYSLSQTKEREGIPSRDIIIQQSCLPYILRTCADFARFFCSPPPFSFALKSTHHHRKFCLKIDNTLFPHQ